VGVFLGRHRDVGAPTQCYEVDGPAARTEGHAGENAAATGVRWTSGRLSAAARCSVVELHRQNSMGTAY